MKYLLLFLAAFIYSCDKVGDIIDNEAYDPPVIILIDASQNNVNPGDTVLVWVEATNPEEGLLTYSWQRTGGRYIEPADNDTVNWIAPLAGGTYELTVTVSNEKKNKSAQKVVNVISTQKPLVNILNPKPGTFVVQGSDVTVSAEAYHDNGLQQVELFVNNEFFEAKDQNSDNLYEFSFKTDQNMIGQTWIMIVAKVNEQNINADSVSVFVEGILPKTGGN